MEHSACGLCCSQLDQWENLVYIDLVHRPKIIDRLIIIVCLYLVPRKEAGDVWCYTPVWNLRAVRHLSPLSRLLFRFSAQSSYSFRLVRFHFCWWSTLTFFQNILRFCFSFFVFFCLFCFWGGSRIRLFCTVVLVGQLGDDSRRYVQLADILYWYLPLCIYITFLFCFWFLFWLSIPFLQKNLYSGINKLNGMTNNTSTS